MAFKAPTEEKLNIFQHQIKTAIDNSKPQLQKDISYWNAAVNVVKKILNVLTKIFSLGHSKGFFRPHEPKAIYDTAQLERDINDKLKPK